MTEEETVSQETEAPLQLREMSVDEMYEAICRYLRIEHYAVKPVQIQRVDAHYEPDASLFEIPRPTWAREKGYDL